MRNLVISGLSLFACASLCVAQSATTASVPASTAATPTATVTAPAPIPWTAAYVNYYNGDSFAAGTGTQVQNFLTVKRKLGASGWSVGATGELDNNFVTGKPESNDVADALVKIVPPDLYKGADGTSVVLEMRTHAPVSNTARQNGEVTILEPRIIATSTVDSSKIDLTYLLVPEFYIYNNDAKGRTTKVLEQYLQASYHIAPKTTLDFAAEPVWTLARGKVPDFNQFPVMPGATYNFTDKISLSAYLQFNALKPELKTTAPGTVLSVDML